MNWDPIHWLCAGLALVLVLALAFGGVQTVRLSTKTLEFEAYTAKVEASEAKNQARFEAENSILVARNFELEGKYNETKTELDKLYADYDRVRKSADTNAKISLSHAASKFRECPAPKGGQSGNLESDKIGISERLERLDSAVISRLARTRDETILLLNQCLAFVQRK